jgi:NitT/TauT family transport system substrate-binding protein
MIGKAAEMLFAASCAVCLVLTGVSSTAEAQTRVRVGWCTSVITHGVAPFAVAKHFGWFEKLGLDVEVVNFQGSSDCVRNVATGEVLVAVPTAEPVALLSLTGVNTQVFYTAFRRNIFGIAVPADSPITKYEDLKGASIGVTSMASAGVVVARSVVSGVGLDPDRDIRIVVSGQPAQSVVLLQRDEIQAVSQWDTQYTLMGLAGLPMRMIEDPLIASFPANSMVALPSTIENQSDVLVRLAQGYTMGAIFAIKDPRRAMEIFQEVYPQVVPSGLDAEEALERGTAMLATVTTKWTLNGETENWGESNLETYQSYMDWLLEAGVLRQPVDAATIVTNRLIDEINADLDVRAVEEALAQ